MELNKIYNMDCLEGMRNIPDKSIDMIIVDPPYGTTNLPWDKIIDLKEMWNCFTRIIKDKGAIVIFSIQPFTSMLIMSNLKMFRYELIWDKVQPAGHVVAHKRPMQLHENICVFSNGNCAIGSKNNMYYFPQGLKPYGKTINHFRNKLPNGQNRYRRDSDTSKIQKYTNYPKSIIKISKEKYNLSKHPTQKPTELISYLIQTYSKEKDIILDPCMGSGSTAISCISTNRNYIGFEILESYYNISQQRINNHNEQLKINFNINDITRGKE